MHRHREHLAAIVAALADPDGTNQALAWAYVGLRVAHSLVQSLVNNIMLRFSVFALSSLVLMALTVRVGLVVF